MCQKLAMFARTCRNLQHHQHNILLLQPMTSHCVMHVKAKLISICPTHFLAEYFVEALQDFATSILFHMCGWLQAMCSSCQSISNVKELKGTISTDGNQ